MGLISSLRMPKAANSEKPSISVRNEPAPADTQAVRLANAVVFNLAGSNALPPYGIQDAAENKQRYYRP